MSAYEYAANKLREYEFCEGCPFVRKVLEIAYSVDNPSLPRPDASALEISLVQTGPRATLNMKLGLVAILGKYDEHQECRGPIKRDLSNRPEWLVKIDEEFPPPGTRCGLEDRHIKKIKPLFIEALNE